MPAIHSQKTHSNRPEAPNVGGERTAMAWPGETQIEYGHIAGPCCCGSARPMGYAALRLAAQALHADKRQCPLVKVGRIDRAGVTERPRVVLSFNTFECFEAWIEGDLIEK